MDSHCPINAIISCLLFLSFIYYFYFCTQIATILENKNINHVHLDRNKRLAKDIVIYGFGNIGSKFLAMFLIPFLTFYVAKEELGFYDTALEAILFMLPLTMLQMRESTFRLLIESNDESYRKHILSSTLFIEGLVFVLLFAIACLLPSFFTIRFLPLIVLSICTFSFYEIYIQAIRSIYSSTYFVLISIITSFLTVTLVLLLYFVFKRPIIEALFTGNILSRLTAILLIELPRRKVIGVFSFRYVKKEYIKEIFSYSIPLLGTALAFGIITSSGKFIVNFIWGVEYNGILGAAQKYAFILAILGTTFYQAWQVTAVKNFKEKGSEKFFSEVFNKYTVVLCLLVVVISFGFRSFKAYLIGPGFYQSVDLIYIYCVSSLFFCLSVFFEVTYQCNKQPRKILYSIVSCAFITVPLTFLLTKYYGLMGYLAALTFAYAYLFIFRYFQTKSTLPISLTKEFFLSCTGLIAGGVLFYGTKNQVIDYLFFFFAALLLSGYLLNARKYITRKIL